MGNYLNQDGKKFYEITHSDIYVDKTELLTYTNSVLQTLQKYICISRPRRFGYEVGFGVHGFLIHRLLQ